MHQFSFLSVSFILNFFAVLVLHDAEIFEGHSLTFSGMFLTKSSSLIIVHAKFQLMKAWLNYSISRPCCIPLRLWYLEAHNIYFPQSRLSNFQTIIVTSFPLDTKKKNVQLHFKTKYLVHHRSPPPLNLDPIDNSCLNQCLRWYLLDGFIIQYSLYISQSAFRILT